MKKIIIAVVIAAIAVGAYFMLTKPKAPVAGVAAMTAKLPRLMPQLALLPSKIKTVKPLSLLDLK